MQFGSTFLVPNFFFNTFIQFEEKGTSHQNLMPNWDENLRRC